MRCLPWTRSPGYVAEQRLSEGRVHGGHWREVESRLVHHTYAKPTPVSGSANPNEPPPAPGVCRARCPTSQRDRTARACRNRGERRVDARDFVAPPAQRDSPLPSSAKNSGTQPDLGASGGHCRRAAATDRTVPVPLATSISSTRRTSSAALGGAPCHRLLWRRRGPSQAERVGPQRRRHREGWRGEFRERNSIAAIFNSAHAIAVDRQAGI